MEKETKGKKYCPGQQSPRGQVRMDRLVNQMSAYTPSHTDPFGSYTGMPEEYGETPVQDADDL